MSFNVLAFATWDALACENVQEVDFVWHGGETTLLPITFFEKALYAQFLFKRCNQVVRNAVQTNATRITPDWARFWKDNDFNVGVSIDGSPQTHDSRRVDKAGRGTWKTVLSGIDTLRQNEIPFGALCVVTEETVRISPADFLNGLCDAGLTSVALLNAIPNASGTRRTHDDYLLFDGFVDWLVRLYEEWQSNFRTRLKIREFESLERNSKKLAPTICVHSNECMGKFITVEPDGLLAPCDKYDGDPDFYFGNLNRETLSSAIENSQSLDRFRAEERVLRSELLDCEYNSICHGGCPHDARMRRNGGGSPQSCCGLKPLVSAIIQRGGEGNGTRNFS